MQLENIAPYKASKPPKSERGVLLWLRSNLFSPWYNGLLTIFAAGLLYLAVTPLWHWGIKNATFGTTPESCQGSAGACWSFIADMWPIFLVGTYPFGQRWRVIVAFGVLLSLIVATLIPKLRRWKLFYLLWALSPLVIYLIIRGGELLSLQYVPSTQWGGLLLTVILSAVSMCCAFPISLLLALGRQSNMPLIKSLCVGFIELIRGVPLITILFMASVVLPLFFPPEMDFSKLLRALVGITLFFSAYLAENIRGGLQGISKGQLEAAKALGLGYWKTMGFIMLPQALKIVIPAMVNNFIGILKDTSLVSIIGLTDLLQAAFAASSNPVWMGKITEAYLFVAAFYWIMCYGLSSFSRYIEKKYETH